MSGRKLRKEGYLYTKLVEPASTMKRLSAATLKSHRQPLEVWRNAYVTLRYRARASLLLSKPIVWIRSELIGSMSIYTSQILSLRSPTHYCKN